MDAYYDTVDYKLKKNKGWVTKFFPERVRARAGFRSGRCKNRAR